MRKASRMISGVGLGLGMTAVGFATWGVLSTGTASASTVARAAATPTLAPATPTVAPTTPTLAPTATATPTVVPTAPTTVPATTVPSAPPATGGGGTAGLQDAVLFGVGGAALLVGSGSIVYRLKGNKQR
jgi:hypothetical protein